MTRSEQPPATPLVVLAGGTTPAAAAEVARIAAELTRRPGTVVVHHDLREVAAGVVHRGTTRDGRTATAVLDLVHGCVSCTLREDVLPLLRHLARDRSVDTMVLRLDPALEPERVCAALHEVVVGEAHDHDRGTVADVTAIRGVVGVLDLAQWLADAGSEEDLVETAARRGLSALPEDERTLAQLVVAHAEFADLLVLAGDAEPWESARTAAVLDRLAPGVRRIPAGAPPPPPRPSTAQTTPTRTPPDSTPPPQPRTSSGSPEGAPEGAPQGSPEVLLLETLPEDHPGHRGIPADPHNPLLRGAPPLDPDAGVALLHFTARRPFHPDRLHTALDALLDGVIRTRGRVWLATRPDAVIALESAGGGCELGHLGDWLAAGDETAWAHASPQRRAAADLLWHARWGDRRQELTVLCHRADPVSTARES